jgi:hypothetical protein
MEPGTGSPGEGSDCSGEHGGGKEVRRVGCWAEINADVSGCIPFSRSRVKLPLLSTRSKMVIIFENISSKEPSLLG